ncbi:hypothetical protein ND16A_3543 [Thalassotalea sp. ND16A]|nr:hypothetical protein ND16A_3543 [Thalassotalea sp. ND16A]
MLRIKCNAFSLAVLLLLISTNSWADRQPKNASICFNNIELPANFIALKTDFDSKLANWYQQVFRLEIVKEYQ